MTVKTFPITLGFDNTQVIGYASIDTSKLPPTPDFHFSIGFYSNDLSPLEDRSYELAVLGLVNDSKFSAKKV